MSDSPLPAHAHVAIVGGGVAGLRLATLLEARGVDYHLLEARPRLGGRIDSPTLPPGAAEHDFAGRFDVGPSWLWPHQREALGLLRELGIETFGQYSDGALLFEDRAGQLQRLGFSTMAGSLRVTGGLGSLVDALAARIPDAKISTGVAVQRIQFDGPGAVSLGLAPGRQLSADVVCIAAPPRLIADTVRFAPPLERDDAESMLGVPTWMASHAKALAIYARPFWREAGLSGDGISHRGPLAEIHDASPRGAEVGALFGFFGLPALVRRAHADALEARVRGQLERMFGPAAARPEHIEIVDWATDPHLATELDRHGATDGHPAYQPLELQGPWRDRVLLCGTEVAPDEGGYIEGALLAARAASRRVLDR